MKILVVDDDLAVLRTISRSFMMCEELEPEVFCAETAEEAREFLRKIDALEVIFLDKQLECADAEELLPDVRRWQPGAKVIVWSGYYDVRTEIRFSGRTFVTTRKEAGQPAMALLRHAAAWPSPLERLCEVLTPRQKDVARLLYDGLPIKEIAARLKLSPKTVAEICTAIYRRTGLCGRAELVAAVNRGDVDRVGRRR